MEFDDDAYDSCEESERVDEDLEDDDPFDMAACEANHKGMKYTVLSLEDICERQHNAITSVASVLSVSEVEAAILLRHFRWDVIDLNEKWFANEEKERNSVGLLLHQVKHETQEEEKEELITCPICFDIYSIRDMKALKYCGHLFCQKCWRGYIHTSINNDRSGCLTLRCPHPDPPCRALVSEDMVYSLRLSEEDNSKYTAYLLRSYVEQNSRIKWCPAPNCEYCVEVDTVLLNASCQDVVCNCDYKFCWNCLEESHRPIDCDTVRKWVPNMSDHGESLSMLWIHGNTKPCPMCKRPIEKNEGCMHIQCSFPCEFEFCWICLHDWNNHDRVRCYRYQREAAGSGKGDGNQSQSADFHDVMKMSSESESESESESDRILFYLERWNANEKCEKEALSRLKHLPEVELKTLRDCVLTRMSRAGLTDFKCVEDAWLQIAECRRMLKWTYAYAYYLPLLHDHDKPKQNLFEFIQRDAESSLERLYQCAATELQRCINSAVRAKDNADIGVTALKEFEDLCVKLEELTKAAGHYFEKLIQEVENA